MSVKAFDLVPAIERLNLTSDKASTQIVCLECCGKNLYFGTDDCFVIHFLIEEQVGPNGRVTFQSQKQGHKYLGLKKPVIQLKAASAINRILVLCDSTLSLLNMLNLEPVLTGSKIKGITAFCLNQNPAKSDPFCVEVCVASKRKSIQVYTVREDHMNVVKDISVSEIPLNMKMDGIHVCVALPSEYRIVNVETSHVQELFSFDLEQVNHIITPISREEYLLNAPNALGVFALVKGVSQRPPLQWSNNISHVAYLHPYILALNDEFITVHSILDQQQKQTIPFSGGRCMGEFDGRIFVTTSRDVYYLLAIPVEKQIQSLLNDKRVSEALDLARNARKTGLSKENFTKMFRRIQQQAGFIEFAQLNFDEARNLFRSGQLDSRELITLYPLLMPTNSSFTRAMPPLNDFADINQIARGDVAKTQEFKDFLMVYLQEARTEQDQLGFLTEMDTALIKLYAEVDSECLVPFITSPDNKCDMADCIQWLKRCQRFHALGLLHSFHGENDLALDVWTRICSNDLQDSSFPGLPFVVEFLANLQDPELVWKYIDWVMERDDVLGVQVFTKRPADEAPSERMKPDLIVDYLARFPKAVILYLEHLIFRQNADKETFHTHLAVLYLDRVLQLMKDPCYVESEVEAARKQLCHLLQVSNSYRVQLLLGKVKETELYAECAILYGKLEEHDKALRLLVHKLRDFSAAERYCSVNSDGKDVPYRTRLFQTLLSVYLDPNNERRDLFVAPAVSLLNNNRAEFDCVKVLQLIPDNWSIGLLHQFLTNSVRKSLSRSRTVKVERMLARGENLHIRSEAVGLTNRPLLMTEERLCAVCSRGFTDPVFLRFPSGVVTHVHCSQNKNICPVTGRLFTAAQST